MGKVIFILGMLCIAAFFVLFLSTFAIEISEQREAKIQTHHQICENIGMEFLSSSEQFFGDDYVICYNPGTNKTKEIAI